MALKIVHMYKTQLYHHLKSDIFYGSYFLRSFANTFTAV
jgi:hypothetical protein